MIYNEIAPTDAWSQSITLKCSQLSRVLKHDQLYILFIFSASSISEYNQHVLKRAH